MRDQYQDCALYSVAVVRLQLLTTCWRICKSGSDECMQGFAVSPGSWFCQL